jgi:hypothetical protein
VNSAGIEERRWKGDERPPNAIGWHEVTGHGAKFGRKKEAAIIALLTQRNVEEAARVAGVGTKTLLRWLRVPEFQTAFRTARREAVSQAVARLQQSTGAAVTTLLKLMVDSNTPASIKARVADSVLANAMKGIEMEDFEVRLAELERIADASKKNGT